MSEGKTHKSHWMAGPDAEAALSTQADAERFAHMTYGELVKHFGLGTTHTFSSWDRLPEDERAKWTAALTEVHAELKERNARTSTQTH
jgi:hypothetical protein